MAKHRDIYAIDDEGIEALGIHRIHVKEREASLWGVKIGRVVQSYVWKAEHEHNVVCDYVTAYLVKVTDGERVPLITMGTHDKTRGEYILYIQEIDWAIRDAVCKAVGVKHSVDMLMLE